MKEARLFSLPALVLAAAALVQSLVLLALLGAASPGIIVTPYFRSPAQEQPWQSFERTAREFAAAPPAEGGARARDAALACLVRGLDDEDELYRLRNRTHHLNTEICRRAVEILDSLTVREQEAVLAGSRGGPPVGKDEPLSALLEALAR